MKQRLIALFAIMATLMAPFAAAANVVVASSTIWHLASSSDCHVEYDILTVTGVGTNPSRMQWQATGYYYYTDWCSNITVESRRDDTLAPGMVVFTGGSLKVSGVVLPIPGANTLTFTGEIVPVESLVMPGGKGGDLNTQLEAMVTGQFTVNSVLVPPEDLTATIAVTKIK